MDQLHHPRSGTVGALFALPLIAGLGWAAVLMVATIRGGGLPQRDFTLYWIAGRLARTQGLAAVYDGHSCARLFTAVQVKPGFTCDYLIYPPQHVWIMEAVSLLPLPVAYGLWCVLICGAFVVAGWILAPNRGARPLWVGLPLVTPALAFGITWLGLMTPLQLLGLTIALLLLKRQPVVSGVLLALFAFKPNAFLFVPFALLLVERRALASFALATCVIVAVTLSQVGVPGLAHYATTLRASTELAINDQLGLSALTGHAQLSTLGLQVIAAAGSVVALWRLRRAGDLAVAAAVPASILVSPHLHSPDLMLALPAAWLWARQEAVSLRPRLGMGVLLGTMTAAVPVTVALACATLAAGPTLPGGKLQPPT